MRRNAIGPLTIGEKVRILRTRRGMMLKEVGEHTGWSITTMSKFESGDWEPRCRQREGFLQNVAEALHTTVEDLCDDDVYSMLRRIGEGVESMDRRLQDLEATTDRIAERMQEVCRPVVADALTESHRV